MVCPKEDRNEISKFSWNVLALNNRKPICYIRNKELKISYNDYPPNFSVENDQIRKDTIEGVLIQSFVDKNNLTTELIDEEMKWGKQDESGTFNGVVGRVI